ncbi:MAG: peptidoglycan editing factor PgeF [Gammaproteobacteria bacterium]|nr:peptidoglycan editing factor PgeF [Gammaproteobacteria bacterium]
MDVISSPLLGAVDGIAHAFFTRHGGVSGGVYASLNCGPGSRDSPHDVSENRARACAALGVAPTRLCTLSQVHGARVVRVRAAPDGGSRPKADALITDVPGIALGVLTADCVPVLIAARDGAVAGAAHAGWKGALGGVLEAVLGAFAELGCRAGELRACIGPAIQQRSYEVGAEVERRFLEQTRDNGRFFTESARAGHAMLDLPGYVAHRLERAGIGELECLALDTYADADRFFSYRRATHLGERDYGRQLSAIALAP